MGALLDWFKSVADRPAWRRAGSVIEEMAADIATTIFLMFCIFVAHSVAHFFAIDKLPVASGFEIGHIFTVFHALNVLINCGYALLRLIQAHRADHD